MRHRPLPPKIVPSPFASALTIRETPTRGLSRCSGGAGENFPSPACTWDVDGLVARGGKILTCTYAGYPSWYGSITTKAVVDPGNVVAESDEGNNTETMTISVRRP